MTTTDTTATTKPEGTEMTDDSQTDPAAPDGTNPPEGTEEGQQSDDHREVFKQREKRREAEAERDRLAGKVAALQRAEAERLAGMRLAAPADLWVAGVKLEDLLADDGNVDQAKFTEAVDKVLADRPHWAAPRVPRVPRDLGQGKRGGTVSGVRSMQQIIRDA